MKKRLRRVSFILIGIMLFIALQKLVTPNWLIDDFYVDPMDAMIEYRNLSEEDSIQALFLGSSHVRYGIDPMEIYKQSGIATFNFGSSAQSVGVSYQVLCEAIDILKPKVVFFDVGSLFRGPFSPYALHYALDYRTLDQYKWALINDYANTLERKEKQAEITTYLFPIYQYHDRWSQVVYDLEFRSKTGRNLYQKGFWFENIIRPSNVDETAMNNLAYQLSNDKIKRAYVYDGDDKTTIDDSEPLYKPYIDKDSEAYLLKIHALCTEKGVELCLLKVPVLGIPQDEGAWNTLKAKMVKALAKKLDVEMIDLQYDYDLDIDWSRDTLDYGQHLNYWGAKKVSDWFANYMKEKYTLTRKESPTFEADMPTYEAVCRVAELASVDLLTEYLKLLSKWNGISVFFCASDDMVEGLTQAEKESLNRFGLRTDFDKANYGDSYLAVIEDGILKYEALSNRRLEYEGSLESGSKYALNSAGWYVGPDTFISIDGENCTINLRGLNIVVYDNETKCVLDSVNFDTHVLDDHVAKRDLVQAERYLRIYEEARMRQDYAAGIH